MNQNEKLQKVLQNIEAMRGSGSRGFEYFKVQKRQGPTDQGDLIRVAMPKWIAPGSFPFIEYDCYDLSGVLANNSRSIVAPHFFGAPDPIHDFLQKEATTTDPDVRQIVDSLKPKRRWTVVGIAPANPNAVTVWSGIPKTPAMAMMAVAAKSFDPESGYNWPFSLEDGHTFEVLRWGPSGSKYVVNVRPRPGKVAENWKELQDMIDEFDVWTRVLPIETKETLQGILRGVYDRDAAYAARKERDEKFGRPYPSGVYDMSDVHLGTPAPAEPKDDLPWKEPVASNALESIKPKSVGSAELGSGEKPKGPASLSIQERLSKIRSKV